jgi:DNA-binding PadR family transcriptional regulator
MLIAMSHRLPHTVPRGLLRFYILRLLTRKAMKGYEVIREIADRTDGVWKPGPGSIYPMLESMKREGLIHTVRLTKRGLSSGRGTSLQISEKGRQTLNGFTETLRHGMPTRARSLYLIFADIAYPGLTFDDVILAERRREVQRLENVFNDAFWGTVSAEKKKEFIEKYSKIVEEELELLRSRLSSVHKEENNA